MKSRWDDLMSIKITKVSIWAILLFLISIISWFIQDWMKGVNVSREACASVEQRVKVIEKDNERVIPMILKSLERIEYKLDKHIDK